MTRPERTPRDSVPTDSPGPARALAGALVLVAVLGVSGLGLAGCRGADRSADPIAGSPGGGTASGGVPEVRAAGDVNGIEVRTWTVDPLGGPIARALVSYATGDRAGDGSGDGIGTLDPSDTRRWREHGFRLVEIPVGAVGVLERELPQVDAARRLWLGEPTVWTGVATRRLASDDGALGGRPTPVRAALVVRSWVEPGVRRGPIRVELAVSGTPIDGRGSSPLLMNELLLTHRLGPGTALVIVPAPPDEVWDQAPVTEPGLTPQDPFVGPVPALAEQPAVGAGEEGVALPPAPPGTESSVSVPAGPLAPGESGTDPGRPGSLGESMLVLPGRILSVPPRPARQVLVIVPGVR